MWIGAVIATALLSITPSMALGDVAESAEIINRNCSASALRIALIGDFGTGDAAARSVAELVHKLNVKVVASVGDNNYPTGSAASLDKNIAQLYGSFLGDGKDKANRFYPALGNHDWMSQSGPGKPAPYLDFFNLPNNERYYRQSLGDVELFIVDSDSREPDGITADSLQARWLQRALTDSKAAWKWVLLHHSPYSSAAIHGSNTTLQWPFQEWGADAVFSGHDHVYERIEKGGLTYFVNGLGGAARYFFLGNGIPGSIVRYSGNHGAMLGCVGAATVWLSFIAVTGEIIDQVTMQKAAAP